MPVCSFKQAGMKTWKGVLKVCAALVVWLATAQAAWASGVNTSNPNLPPNIGVYVTSDQVHATYNGPGFQIVLQDIRHQPFASTTVRTIVNGTDEQEEFDSHFDANGSVNGGALFPIQGNGDVTTVVMGKAGNTTGTFQTEMVVMTLTVSSPFGPFKVRESLTLPSTGVTTITDIGGGMYHIDSFFDVFTELSIDGGQTWIPQSDGPSRVNLVPEVPLIEPGPLEPPPAVPGGESPRGNQPELGVVNSIYLFSGEFYHGAVDMRIRGRGFDFVWARKYRSRYGPNTAMGNGWDFSYNIFIEPSGENRILHDGNTRRDLYALQPDGTWAREEFFRVLSLNPNNTYTLTFADTGKWNFKPLDGSAAQGKISSIVDRNGNTMVFHYDPAGRVDDITDTLNRHITINYNGDGLISSVSDFAGRQVVYSYYQNSDTGGSARDLKSARSPIVDVPAPANHNNFTLGKTTTYAYSEDFADPLLNSNLKTITDPKGQTYLVNTYSATQNSSDLNFDRVTRQVWGNPDDIIDVVYVEETPSPINHFAVIKAIVNDRLHFGPAPGRSNVKQYFYDATNRLVVARDYTGRAAADQPTSDFLNVPTSPLRGDDPQFFETSWEYNVDSLPTLIVYPRGNSTTNVYELELDANAPRRSRGNLREVHRMAGPPGGDQPMITELYEYATGFGGCCGTNFVTRAVDGRGNETLHTYDAWGNRLHTQHRIPSIVEDFEYNGFGQMTVHRLPANGSGHRRRDEYTYYSGGIQNGYLESEIVDATGLALTASYEYDTLGRVIRRIDARGHDMFYTVNALGQVVREQSREVATPSGAVRYETLTWYDLNDNVVRVDVQNVNDQGVVQAGNTHFSTIYEYEILNRRTRTIEEKGSSNLSNTVLSLNDIPSPALGQFIVSENEYDGNRNLVNAKSPLAVENVEPANRTLTHYDERDLVFQTVRSPGTPRQMTVQTDYDGNGNVTKVSSGIEDAQPRITFTHYDGYNRVWGPDDASPFGWATLDPMGNQTFNHYDDNGNRTSERVEGELIDVAGSAANVRLAERTFYFDNMDRAFQTDVDHFVTEAPQLPIGDGQSTTITAYADNSQVVSVTDDNLHTTTTAYDTANRRILVTDARGNTVEYAYDENSNVKETLSSEYSDLSNPAEFFYTTMEYDNLDRLIQTMDNIGNHDDFAYDSRNNQVKTTDALEHQVAYEYDGLDRPTRTVHDMDGDGPDAPLTGPDPDVVTKEDRDNNSRLISQADDNENDTMEGYDDFGFPVSTDYADCPNESRTHDVHGNLLADTDQNGTVVNYQYDLLNRVTFKSITVGAGVSSDTTFEMLQYDGLGRLVSAENDKTLVSRDYDSLGNILEETLALNGPVPAQTVTSTYDGVGNKLSCAYPGGRVVTMTYDELNRKITISDNQFVGVIAMYDYIGPSRVERRTYGNGTQCDYQYDGIANAPGDSGVKQIVRTQHTVTGTGDIIDDRTYAWDKMGNKTQRKDERFGGPTLLHEYCYDAIYRLCHTTVTNWYAGTPVRETDYVLDGVGNRVAVSGAGTPDAGLYNMIPGCGGTLEYPPADEEMNQYTSTSFDARTYDDNGNLTHRRARQAKDLDGDGDVDNADFLIFAACRTGPTILLQPDPGSPAIVPPPCPACAANPAPIQPESQCARCDFDGDGDVDLDDHGELQVCYSGENVLASTACGGPTHQITYDYANRMVEFLNRNTGRSNTYAYDALGRRIRKVVNANGVGTPVETRFILDGWQEIEEQSAGGSTVATYVYGLYVDEVLTMRRGTISRFYHTDDLYNVMAVTDSTGQVVERYDYADYGSRSVFAPDGTLRPGGTAIGNPYLFTGRRYDNETGLYYYRTRYLDPRAGRFTSRDTIGSWGDLSNVGNAYQLLAANPITDLDPFGEETKMHVDKYWLQWRRDHPGFTNEKYALAEKILQEGCVGITKLALGCMTREALPPLQHCYKSFDEAERIQRLFKKEAKCRGKLNSRGQPSQPRIFAMFFEAKTTKYREYPDKKNNVTRVEMGEYKKGKEETYMQFDFGLWDDKDAWYDANAYHLKDGKPMEVIINSKKEFEGQGYGKKVWCVACEDWTPPRINFRLMMGREKPSSQGDTAGKAK